MGQEKIFSHFIFSYDNMISLCLHACDNTTFGYLPPLGPPSPPAPRIHVDMLSNMLQRRYNWNSLKISLRKQTTTLSAGFHFKRKLGRGALCLRGQSPSPYDTPPPLPCVPDIIWLPLILHARYTCRWCRQMVVYIKKICIGHTHNSHFQTQG